MTQTIKLHIISDSVGETAMGVANASLAQFPHIDSIDFERYPFVDSKEELLSILEEVRWTKGIIIATLVSKELETLAREFATEHQLTYINPMSQLVTEISHRTGLEPSHVSGSQYQLDDHYFDRIQAIEFAVKYDDGKNTQGYALADIILLGISRSSKTPLSMYLANRSYKVANLPIFPESPLPRGLDEIPKNKLFGLIASPQYIGRIRKERLKHLGLPEEASYSNIDRIKDEYRYAQNLYHELGIQVVNIENKSIEELAEEIVQLYEP